MIDNQQDLTTEPVPTARPWWRKRPAQIAIAVIAVWGAISIWAFTSGGATAPIPTSTLYLSGTLEIPFISTDGSPQALDTASSDTIQTGDACQAVGGFSDIAPGAAVTFGGSKGQTLVVTALAAGSVAGSAAGAYTCEFDFGANVDSGLPEYTVTISHRGMQVFTPSQVAQGDIVLTLGD